MARPAPLCNAVPSSLQPPRYAFNPGLPVRPNILWITCEDLSPVLGCYGDAYAATPNLDKFAQRSTRYDRAYATAPVCTPSRSCLITGRYATSLGSMHLRGSIEKPCRCSLLSRVAPRRRLLHLQQRQGGLQLRAAQRLLG